MTKPTGSPRGGARPGSGRKPGSANKELISTAAILAEEQLRRAAAGLPNEDGRLCEPSIEDIAAMSPLQIIQYAMVRKAIEGEWQKAAELAAMAAPYRHARLAQMDLKAAIKRNTGEMTDDELAAIAAGGSADAADEAEGEARPSDVVRDGP